ncbi:MAG: two-component regulator propeller domain-containing protein [Ginsengibacter sp.]
MKLLSKIKGRALPYPHLLILLAISFNSFSQAQHIKFEHIGTNMGLSQSNVICIFQDSRGFMWFGTRDGLNKYDGYKFTVYKYDAENENSLSQNTVQDIIEDHDGNLWIATEGGGLNKFDREKEKFIRFKNNSKDPHSIRNDYISKLMEDEYGNLWIATNGGLNMYDKLTNKFSYYLHNQNDPKTLIDDRVCDIVEDKEHNIWLATVAAGFDLFDRKTKTFRHFRTDIKDSLSVASNNHSTLFIDDKDQLWIGTRGNGLSLFDKKNETFKHYLNKLNDKDNGPNVIRTIKEDDKENLWIGTENGGLCLFDIQTETFQNYAPDEADNSSLSDISIWSLCKDKKGNMWVGTFSSGLNFVNHDANKFAHYSHTSSPLSLNNNKVLAIVEDSKQNLWIGTDGGGMDLFNSKTGAFTHYVHDASNKNSLCGNYVLAICEDSEGSLWIGTWADGITVFNKEKNSYTHFKYDPANPNGLSSPNIRAIFEDNEKDMWVVTFGAGFCKYDKKNNNFIRYPSDAANTNTVGNAYVNMFFEDSKQNLWIATHGSGLDLFNKKTNTFKHFLKIENKNSISNNVVYCMAEDKEGNLWIGTDMGLNRMDKNGAFINYNTKDGLPSNSILGLLIDKKSNLWVSTLNGLSRFDPITKVFKNFGINDGLQSNEFKMNSCFQSLTGKMYFGGVNGFNEFNPDNTKEKTYEPPLVLTDFQIFNSQVPISVNEKDKSPLKKNITDTKEMILSYKQSVISFEFSSLDYGVTDKKQYSYMLEGFDKDWNNIGSKHTATYTNLDPGKYLFKVRGLNNEGEWSSQQIAVRLTITPPFWLTWWFKLLAFVSVVGGAIGFYMIRINAMNAQKIKLQQQVKEQTHQLIESTELEQMARQEADKARLETDRANAALEKKNKELEQFAYIASHDLQEPLRTTSSFVKLLQKHYQAQADEKTDKYFTFVLDASDRMKELIKNLLDFSRIGNKKELEQVDCNGVLNNVLADLGVAISEAKADVTYTSLPVITGYPTELKQLFQNLITNAIKFRKEGVAPQINISVKQIPGYWEFSFKDNGIGIEEKYNEKIFVIFQRLHTRAEYEGTGIGLSHCKKIVELHKGEIWVKSTPGQGSTFHFTIRKINITQDKTDKIIHEKLDCIV